MSVSPVLAVEAWAVEAWAVEAWVAEASPMTGKTGTL